MIQISLVTATYNAAVTLDHCLQSVASQTFTPEHLIIDGCSTDETLTVAGNHSGHLLQVVSEPDNGIYDAMNKGIKRLKEMLSAFLNADDFYASPEVLGTYRKLFKIPLWMPATGICFM